MRFNQPPIYLASLLAGLLTACPAPTAPTVASISIAGAPTDNNLKINAPATLTATAKDSSGVAITGTTFTWVSSNPDAVSVDAGGVVTAKKFGDAIITASAGGVSAATSSVKTYGLEVIGGTRTSLGSSSVGTAIFLRFRKANGAAPSANVPVSVTGPSDWNSANTLTLNTAAGWTNWWFSRLSLLAKSGNYTANATIDGEAYSSSFSIDATQTLASPASVTVSNISTTGATGTWSTVTGAAGYLFEVWNKTDNVNAAGLYDYTTALTSSQTGLGLVKGKTYYGQTHSMNFLPTTGFSVALPAQFNVGFVTSGDFTTP
jgi:Bacterial Ig-like domain (group 2)